MNERSLESFSVIKLGAKSQRNMILERFLTFKTTGTIGEVVIRSLGGPEFDKTGFARLSELKGVSLGHAASLIRTGDVGKTAQGNKADILIHIDCATTEQIQAHLDWLNDERQKRRQSYTRWLDEEKASPASAIKMIGVLA